MNAPHPLIWEISCLANYALSRAARRALRGRRNNASPAEIEAAAEAVSRLAADLGMPPLAEDVRRTAGMAIAAGRLSIGDAAKVLDGCRPVLITRHEGAVDWLQDETGIRPLVIPHVDDPATLCGRVVIGILPLHVAATLGRIWAIDLPALPQNLRGKELSADQMRAAGARLVCYRVERVTPE